MPTLVADYGYDSHELDLTEEEAEKIRSGQNLEKTGEVFLESEMGMVDAVWSFDFSTNSHWISCDDGATFYILSFQIND